METRNKERTYGAGSIEGISDLADVQEKVASVELGKEYKCMCPPGRHARNLARFENEHGRF